MKSLDPRTLPLWGNQLVEASAGTGKTHTITWLVLRLLLERKLGLDQILVVTFTQAATAELRVRVRQRLREAAGILRGQHPASDLAVFDPLLGEWLARRPNPAEDSARIEAALYSIDEASIYTIHGFCQRVLQEHAFEAGARFEFELVADLGPVLRELVEDFWARELYRAGAARVRYLTQRGTRLSWLVTLAQTVTDWPAMPVLPAMAPEDPDSAVAAYLAVRDRVARAWPEARDEVSRLLRSSPAINRKLYPRPSVEEWLGSLASLLAQTEPSTVGFGPEVPRFTVARLRSATKKGQPPPTHPFFELCTELEAAGARAQRALEAWRLGFLQEFVTHVRREFGDRKQRLGVLTFTDLLGQVAEALRGPHGQALVRRLRERHPAAVVDEFQDTDPLQYEILRSIYPPGAGTLLLIGDPKQAIYGFRGADVFAYLDAAESVGRNQTWTLTTNYRSDPGLLRAINGLFGDLGQPFLFDQIDFVPVVARPGASDQLHRAGVPLPPFELAWMAREGRTGSRSQTITKRWADAELPALVAGQVVELLESGVRRGDQPLRPGDIAILTRTNRQALTVQRALSAVRVPSVLEAQASVLDTPEAAEFGALLSALVTPTRAAAVRTALAAPLFGLGGEAIYALNTDENAWQTWLERFHGWHDLWERRGFIQAFRGCFEDARIPPRLLKTVGGERKLTNLIHLGELLHTAATSGHLGMAGLVRWFEQVRHDPRAREEVAAEARQIRLETDEHAVRLVTLHKSKGLEYPIVICPHLWDGTTLRPCERELLRYHDGNDRHQLKLDLRDPADKQAELVQAEREALAEQLRLVYVALTRAKHRVSVVLGAFNTYERSALAYLLHRAPNGGTDPARVAERVRGLSDQELLRDLERFRSRAGSVVEVRLLEPSILRPWVPVRPEADELVCPIARRALTRVWRGSSFTGLTTGLAEVPSSLGGRGRDEFGPSAGRWARDEPGPVPAALPSDALPRGPILGTAVHAMLERADFTRPEELEWLVRVELGRRPELARVEVEPLTRLLGEVLITPLARTGAPRLADLRPEVCLKELEFLLPVSGAGAPVTPTRLGRVFERWAAPPVPGDYPARVAELGFPALLGYLRGYIDLVFVDQGRYFLVDYKSNHLGAYAEDYAPERLSSAMVEHHYFLQYHLYVVALHRLLGLRLAAYSYERHFGGVYYIFLRGVGRKFGAGHGVFFDRPSRELVRELDRELGTLPESEESV